MAILQRIPGSARRYVDLETGVEYSRRQADAIRERQGQKARSDRRRASAIATKRYWQLVESYREKQKQQGKKLGKRAAAQSAEMKGIIKDLKSKDPFRKLQALKKTTRRDGIPDTIPVGESPKVGG